MINDIGVYSPNGAENFTDVDVVLVNAQTGEEIDLKQTTSYDFNLIDGGIGALFIQFRNVEIKTELTNEQLINWIDSIHITNTKKTINITSSINNPINDIFVYDCVGHLIKEIRNVNCVNYELIGPSSGVYIINVCSKNICIKKKILIN